MPLGFESANAASLNQCDNLNIVAQDILFAYDKRKIIDGVSLTIPAGSTTAFVGPSGGKKSLLP